MAIKLFWNVILPNLDMLSLKKELLNLLSNGKASELQFN